MRFLVYDWAYGSTEQLKEIGYEHNTEYEGDIFEVAQKAFDAGLNVKVCHPGQNSGVVKAILMVDTKMFTQR